MLTALSAIEKFLMRWTMRAAMALLVLAVIVSFYQVITRFVFEEPSTWSEVTARSLDIWMVYLGVAVAFRQGALIAVEFVHARTHGTARVLLVTLISGLSLGVLAVIAWAGWEMVDRVKFQMLAGVDNPFTGDGISIATVYAAIPVGAVLSMIGAVARAVEEIAAVRRTGTAPAAPQEVYEV